MEPKVKVPLNCLFQGCYNPVYEAEIRKCKDKCYRYNQQNPNDAETLRAMLAEILGSMGRDVVITPPFWCDYGYNIAVGDKFYSNHNLIITDGARVTFGNNVFIAPNCCFTTAEHPTDPEQRKAGLEIAKPITVGDNVWIGAGSTVLAGVTIGNKLPGTFPKTRWPWACHAEFCGKSPKRTNTVTPCTGNCDKNADRLSAFFIFCPVSTP